MSASSRRGGLRGVLFDVDGTLYRQGPLRMRMAAELAAHALSEPLRTLQIARVIRSFRSWRERFRTLGVPGTPLSDVQYAEPAAELGIDPGVVARVVSEWMERRPLRHLMGCRREGVVAFLERCKTRGLALGAYSDYPPRAKVEALGLTAFFDLHLCSTDPEVNAFKPSPAGILEACRRWGVAPSEVLYVGDRGDADGGAAKAAGARFVLVGRSGFDEAGVADLRRLGESLAWEEE